MKYKLKYVEDLSPGAIVDFYNTYLLLLEIRPFWKKQVYDKKLQWRLKFLKSDGGIYDMIRCDGDTLEVISK